MGDLAGSVEGGGEGLCGLSCWGWREGLEGLKIAQCQEVGWKSEAPGLEPAARHSQPQGCAGN